MHNDYLQLRNHFNNELRGKFISLAVYFVNILEMMLHWDKS